MLKGTLRWLLPIIIGIITGALASGINHFVFTVWGILKQDGLHNRTLFFIYGMMALALSYLLIHALSRTRTPQSSFHTLLEVYHLSPRGMRLKESIVRTFSAISTLAFGGSAGPEGPAAIIGGGIGSALARFSSLDGRKAFLLGAAAGISASFRAPFTGILLALELPYKKDLEMGTLLEATLASASAYLISILLDTPHPEFHISWSMPMMLLLLAALCLGAIMGLLARGFIHAYHLGEAFAKRLLARGGYPLMVLIGGLGLGLAGFILPNSVGPSYETIPVGQTLTLLLGLALLRTFSTIMTLTYGGTGGLFLPTVTIGATAGALVANLVDPSQISTLALLGAAAFSAGVHKIMLAPATFIAELGGSGLIIPAFLASVVSFFTSGREGVYHIQPQTRTEKEELALERFYRRVMMLKPKGISESKVSEVMTKEPFRLYSDMTVREALRSFMGTPFRVLPIVDRSGRLVGYTKLEELAGLPKKALGLRLDVVGMHKPFTLHPDEGLLSAIERMIEAEVDHAFVVDEDGRLIGIVSSIDLIRMLLKHYTRL